MQHSFSSCSDKQSLAYISRSILQLMSTTYPKANTVTVGYDATEDRMFLILYLQDGNTRKAYISRRLLGMLLKSMGDKLSTTSTTASRTPNPSEVMQMEHIAAVVSRKPGEIPKSTA